MRSCECGCGDAVTSTDKRTRFVNGHHLRKARAARSINQLALSRAALTNRSGLCECGCGEPSPISAVTSRRRGWVAGEPVRFIPGHNARGLKRGIGRYVHHNGYVMIRMPSHPDSAKYKGYVLEHRYVMEQTLGRPLRGDEHVHHLDHDRTNNAPENLIVVDPITHATYHGGQVRRTQSPEHRAKISAHMKRVWAERQAGISPMPNHR